MLNTISCLFECIKSIKLSLTIFTLLITMLISHTALAAAPGFFMGVNAIYGNYDANDLTSYGTTYTPDKTTYGGGFTLGSNLSESFALEAGLEGLAKIDYDGSGEGDNPDQQVYFAFADIKPMVQNKYLVGFARLGAAAVDIQQNNVSGEDTESGIVRPLLGLGFGINLSPETVISLSFNHIEDSNQPLNFGMLEFTHHFVTHYTPGGFIAD